MPAFILAFLGKVGAWLTGKVGVVVGPILYYVIEKFAKRLWTWTILKIADWRMKRERARIQKEAQKKLENDVQTGAPRNEETRKNEEDNLNS
jgi:hypothetical protein